MSENNEPLFYPIASCETAFDRSHQVVTLLLKYYDDAREVRAAEGLRLHVDQAQQVIALLQQAVETAKSQPRIVN